MRADTGLYYSSDLSSNALPARSTFSRFIYFFSFK